MIRLHWRKMRLECANSECPVGTFTEWLPAVPPRARLISRERGQIGADIGDDLRSVAAAARRHGVSERTAQATFDDYADEKLADLRERPGPVEAAGSTSSAVAPPGPPLPAGRPARNGSPTWWTSKAAAS